MPGTDTPTITRPPPIRLSRLQELFDTLSDDQADVLEAVLTRSTQEELREAPGTAAAGDDRAIGDGPGRAAGSFSTWRT